MSSASRNANRLMRFAASLFSTLAAGKSFFEEHSGNPLLSDSSNPREPCGTQCPRCRGDMDPSSKNHYQLFDRDGLTNFLIDTFIDNPVRKVTPAKLVELLFNSKPGQTIYRRQRSDKPFSLLSYEFTISQLIATDIFSSLFLRASIPSTLLARLQNMASQTCMCALAQILSTAWHSWTIQNWRLFCCIVIRVLVGT